jgi:carboxyl-terminal processing protease
MKSFRNIIVVLALVILSYGIGFRIGNRYNASSRIVSVTDISGKESQHTPGVDFSLFWDVWERVSQHYIDKTAVDSQKMVYGAISGMVASLGDPYTVFLPPDQNKESKEDLSGKFEGIGAQLGVKDKKIVIVAPLKDSPAEKAGLKPGDWIIKVDGKETINWTLPETVSKIRGQKGTEVKLTVVTKEASKSSELAVVRDSINVSSVEWEVKEAGSEAEKIIYLKLGRFGDQTNDEWTKAIDEITGRVKSEGKRVKGLVFDLRNNPGGYLNGSVFIASEFLKDGTIVMQENSDGKRNTFTVNRNGRLLTIPVIVLVNKGSASASEIVAGALKDRNRAKLVGETTFGKGSIQEAQELPNGAGIHITTAKWLLPSGKWINGSGIEPDVPIEFDENNPDQDVQLEKAIELLSK